MKINLNNKQKKGILLCLCFVTMAAIYGFSSYSAVESSGQSGSISRLISQLFGGEMSTLGMDTIEVVVRKVAHILEYALLGGLWYGYFLCTSVSGKKQVGFTLLISVFYAISDEVHQFFVPGRAARAYDIGFDTLGIILGILTVVLLLRKKRRNEKCKQK